MKTMLTIAALVAASFSAPALAQGEPLSINAHIRTADLDLTTDAGVRALDRRIRNAAVTLCGIPSSADPNGKRTARECRADARAQAYAQRQAAIASARQPSSTSLAAAR